MARPIDPKPGTYRRNGLHTSSTHPHPSNIYRRWRTSAQACAQPLAVGGSNNRARYCLPTRADLQWCRAKLRDCPNQRCAVCNPEPPSPCCQASRCQAAPTNKYEVPRWNRYRPESLCQICAATCGKFQPEVVPLRRRRVEYCPSSTILARLLGASGHTT